ncbi:phasin family protein [Acidocella sp. MX-AZ03]|uniref:phasin family protein n=1 Tax=Acidocella sp. MX-AZ03 TaxID=2697363 RepID=UPI0022DDD646|nr:phasin family protein [Acidocella sp. MX-AZ03]WBO59815.1 phasin family protein [Acidocella sp. MX-AZ03]
MVEKTTKAGTAPFMPEFDIKKLMGDMKIPAMPDVEAVLAAHKRNLDALTEANRVALEGAQLVARRHMEIMQETMSGLTSTLKELAGNQPRRCVPPSRPSC